MSEADVLRVITGVRELIGLYRSNENAHSTSLQPSWASVGLASAGGRRGLDQTGLARPVLFRQVRVGKGLRPFSIYKLRTMAESGTDGKLLTIGKDRRITRVGRFLRRYKLDELPQLLNVLKGDMSIVGSRPEVPCYVELYRSQFSSILTMRPGITDLASLKFVDEAATLERAADPEEEYRKRILPEKIQLAELYKRLAPSRSIWRSSPRLYCSLEYPSDGLRNSRLARSSPASVPGLGMLQGWSSISPTVDRLPRSCLIVLATMPRFG